MDIDRNSNASTTHQLDNTTHRSSTPFKRPHIDNSSTESTPNVVNSNRNSSKVNKDILSSSSFRSSPSSTYRPVVIIFSVASDKSPYKLVKLLLNYWKTKTSIDINKLNVVCRFGYNKRLLVIPQDSYTFDALQVVPFPEKIDKIKIEVKKSSSTPIHHSIVIHDIPLDTAFDDVKNDLEQSMGKGTVKHVVRLYQNSGKQLKSIRVDFAASNFVTSILEMGSIKLLHGRHAVKEYYLPSRVLTCNKCHQHGHLVKECPNEAVCIRCGLDHTGKCQSNLKCVNCGGEHFPGQSICPEVQKIRQDRNKERTYAQVIAPQSTRALQTGSSTPHQSGSTSIPRTELENQFKIYFDKRIDEIKSIISDKIMEMSEQIKGIAERLVSDKVSHLEERLIDAERRIVILQSKNNYGYDLVEIKRSATKTLFETVLLPAFTDISKAIAASTRNQALRKEVEIICNAVQIALQKADIEEDEQIVKIQQNYPLLKFNNKI